MDIGGTHVTAAYVDLGTRAVLPGHSFREPHRQPSSAEEIVAALVACAARLDARDAGSWWPIALPGPFDYEQGVGRYANVGKFDALNGYDLRTAFVATATRRRRRPHELPQRRPTPSLLGEWWAGSARGPSDSRRTHARHRRRLVLSAGRPGSAQRPRCPAGRPRRPAAPRRQAAGGDGLATRHPASLRAGGRHADGPRRPRDRAARRPRRSRGRSESSRRRS